MAVWAVKRDDEGETNERLLKRWKRQCNGARVMNPIRAGRYQRKAATKRVVRQGAVIRTQYQEEAKKRAIYS